MLIEKHPIYPIRAPEAPTAVTQNTIHLAIVYRQTELAIEPNLMKCLRLVKVFREKYKRQTVWPIVVLPLQSATFSLVLFSGSKRIVNSPRHHPLVENGVPPAAHRALIGSINYTSRDGGKLVIIAGVGETTHPLPPTMASLRRVRFHVASHPRV